MIMRSYNELSTRVPIRAVGPDGKPLTTTDGQNVYFGPKAAAKFGVAPGTLPDPRPLSGDALTAAAVAAYNAGSGAVIRAIAVGHSPDFVTTGGDYSSWVLAHVASLTSAVV